MARHLGEDDRFVWLVRQAAPLHDLGKIAIPDSILLKPGQAGSDEEFEVVKTHAVLGARVLDDGKSEVLGGGRADRPLAPRALGRQRLPGRARGRRRSRSRRGSCAVADVFDVLVHERPYKEAWSVEDAAGELRAARAPVRPRGDRGVRRAGRRQLDDRLSVQLGSAPGSSPPARAGR